MNTTILLEKYKLYWKEKNENVVVAELRHYIENEFGGTIETPIGIILCFKEESPIIWRIKIVLRNDVKYSQTRNQTYVRTKSAFKSLLNYYLIRFADFISSKYIVDPEFDKEIEKYLIENRICSEPYSISRTTEKSKYFEFVGQIPDYD